MAPVFAWTLRAFDPVGQIDELQGVTSTTVSSSDTVHLANFEPTSTAQFVNNLSVADLVIAVVR